MHDLDASKPSRRPHGRTACRARVEALPRLCVNGPGQHVEPVTAVIYLSGRHLTCYFFCTRHEKSFDKKRLRGSQSRQPPKRGVGGTRALAHFIYRVYIVHMLCAYQFFCYSHITGSSRSKMIEIKNHQQSNHFQQTARQLVVQLVHLFAHACCQGSLFDHRHCPEIQTSTSGRCKT